MKSTRGERSSATPAPRPTPAPRLAQKSPRKTAQKAPHKSAQKILRDDSPRKRKREEEVNYESDTHGNDDDEGDFAGDDSDGSEESDEAEGEWDGDGDEEDENGDNSHLCIHCQLDEDHDPASDYEEPLGCAVCAAFSHRNCDREANESGGVKSAFDDDTSSWRCPTCASSDLQPGERVPPKPRVRRRSLIKEKGVRRLRKRKADELDDDDMPISARRRKRRDQKQMTASGSESDGDDAENGGLTNGIRKQLKLDNGHSSHVSITKAPKKLIIKLKNLDSHKLFMIVASVPNPGRWTARSITPRARQKQNTSVPVPPPPTSSTHPVVYEDDRSKPYGGILSEEDADTSETVPGPSERDRFESAKKLAEEEQKTRSEIMTVIDKSYTEGREQKEKEARRVGEASLIECIHFGEYEIDTWYAAPYPEEYSLNRILWICEYCLKYMNSEYVCWRHKMKCPAKHPPGDEIYRDGSISVFEIDGRKQPVYCQNLCLMAKLFLGSKTLYYDVHPFLFYVMTERNEDGLHLVGYFSKEKREGSPNNVSCIITLPIHQRKGYGNLLIDFSYLLTRVEKRTGSPEKPFSDLGLVSYRNYWKLRLCYELRHQKDPVTINELSKRTGMTTDDIICGLEALNALARDPVTGYYALRLDYQLFEAQIERWEAKGYVKLNTKALVWTPYLMGRSQAEHLDHMPLSTIAPRHGVGDEKEKAKKTSEDAARQSTSDITGTTQIDPLEDSLAPNGLGNSEVRPADSVNPALISLVDTTTITTTTAESSAVSSPHASSSTGGLLSTLRSIPPTRFEVVPPPHGHAPRRGRPPLNSVFKVASSRRRTSSPAVSKPPRATPLRSGATSGIAKTIRRGRTKLADSDSAGNDSPVPIRGKGKGNMGRGRPIVTKAPRNRSLTAEMSVVSGKGDSQQDG